MLTRLKSSFNLIFALVGRDIQVRYRRSFLGPAWAVLQPLVLMVLFNMMSGFVHIPSDGVPYIIFSYSALVPWTFFTNAVTLCGPSIASNAPILKKMALPREVFPVSAVTTALFDFLMAFVILIGMMMYFSVPFTRFLVWLPVLLVMTAVLALSIGMFMASIGTFKRDFILATPFLMQFWLMLTPIIYPLSSVPEKYRNIYVLNPMVGIIEGFRDILIHGRAPNPDHLLVSFVIILGVFLFSWLLFRSLSQYFSDVL